jgi:hypothetical protein
LCRRCRRFGAGSGLGPLRGPDIAVLAMEVGLACFGAGRTTGGNHPRTLAEHVAAAFTRLNERG